MAVTGQFSVAADTHQQSNHAARVDISAAHPRPVRALTVFFEIPNTRAIT
jgi:hypothetical protein